MSTKLFALLTFGLLLTQTSAWGEDLLKNGSFEEANPNNRTQPAAWQVAPNQGEQLEINPEHYSGKLGGMLVGDGKLHSWSQDVIAPTGREWTLSLAVKGYEVILEDSDFANLSGRIVLTNGADDEAVEFSIPFPKGSFDWELPAIELIVPEGAQAEKIEITVAGKFKFGRIYVDNVSLTPRDPHRSPAGYLTRKIDDLEQGLKKIGSVDGTVPIALAELAAAKAALAGKTPDLAKARGHWEAGAKAVSHEAWAALYPDAMSDKPVEAQMIYHGLEATKAGCDAHLDTLELAGANGVFLSFGSWMYVVYHSEILPIEKGWEDFDALAYFIDEAHRRGIKVFGYTATFYGTSAVQVLPKSIALERPEWLAKGPDPNMPTFPDPANEEVVDFMVRVYQELATKYKLDGVGLDYIRYPTGVSLNYDENNRQKILKRYGIDILEHDNLLADRAAWAKVQQYRRETMVGVVERLAEGMREVRPDISVMACLISDREHARDDLGQDWAEWSRYIDLASPMNYDDDSLDGPLLQEQAEAFQKSGAKFVPAVGGMPVRHETWTISDWARRIAFTQKYDLDGIIVYRIAELDPAVAAFFGKGPFYSKATFPEPRQW
jgi:uncharacterized lipoprotein YddW (UPF0748 family)